MANTISNASPLPPPNGGAATTRTRESEAAAQARQSLAAGGTKAPAAPDNGAQSPQRSADELAQATRDITDYIQSVSRSLQISVDGELGTTVIRVLDAETDEVVRQIPAEEILQIARYLSDTQAVAGARESVLGFLVDREG